MKNIDNIDL